MTTRCEKEKERKKKGKKCEMKGRVFDVEEVQRRCRACDDKSDAEWQNMCSGGFLAEGERVEEVIARDAAELSKQGWSAEEMGKQLHALADGLVGERGKEKRFEWERRWFVGRQYSPFRSGEVHAEGWNEEWVLRGEQGTKMVLTRGSADMVADFGFFQGGLDGSNRYRLDPHVVHAMVTGSVSREAKEWMARRREFKNQRRKAEREKLVEEMKPRMHEQGAAEFLAAMLAKLKDK